MLDVVLWVAGTIVAVPMVLWLCLALVMALGERQADRWKKEGGPR